MKKIKKKNLLLMLIGAYICFTLVNQQIIMQRQKTELKKYTVELEKTKEENMKLQDEVKLSQSLKYIEKLAREKLGLVKEGETPVIDNSGTK
ncbi:septum formation initiator family protein [Clostridium sp.]|uniref:FtsB family cell division protein n=1 Tax=Clostridium sp. TaxID=1506 RepID=UPI002FCB9A4A